MKSGQTQQTSRRRQAAAYNRTRVLVAKRTIPVALLRSGGRMPASSTEFKNIDVNGSTAIVAGSANAVVTLLNGVAQGTTATTRLGRRITMRSLLVKADFNVGPTTTGASPIRVLIVYDCQTNATAPTATDVCVVDQLNSPMNLSNSRRFKTLVDEMIPCVGTAGPQSFAWNRYVKLNNAVEFNTGSAGTVGDIQTGSIYMLVWTNGTFTVAAPTASIFTRVRFSDN